jgi:hypothetical protein
MPMGVPHGSWGVVGKNVFLVAFFALQLAAAVPGFVYDKHETRGNFSWNMYSTSHECSGKYALVLESGKLVPIEYENAFNRPQRAHIVFHRDTLPEFHRYLCDELVYKGGGKRIHGQVECKIDKGRRIVLVERSVDVCTAPGWGVR